MSPGIAPTAATCEAEAGQHRAAVLPAPAPVTGVPVTAAAVIPAAAPGGPGTGDSATGASETFARIVAPADTVPAASLLPVTNPSGAGATHSAETGAKRPEADGTAGDALRSWAVARHKASSCRAGACADKETGPPVRTFPEAADLERCFAANARQVRVQLQAVRKALAAQGVGESDLHTIELVLAEVMNNVVEHAYRGEERGTMRLSLRLERDALRATVTDCGRPFAICRAPFPARQSLPPCAPGEVPEGGFGWQLIRRLGRSIAFRRDGAENVLAFSIPLS